MDVEPQNTVNDIRCKVEHLMPGPLTRASKLYFNNNDVLEFIPEPTHHDLVLDYMYIGRPIMVDSIVCKNPTLSHFNVVSGSTLYVREPLLCQCPSLTHTPCNKLCVQFQGKLIFSFNLKPDELISSYQIIHDIIAMKIEGVPLNKNILHLFRDNKLLHFYNLFKFTEAPTAVVYVDLRVVIFLRVKLPTGLVDFFEGSGIDTVLSIKNKIKAKRPEYPAHQQRLIHLGHCDDLQDDLKLTECCLDYFCPEIVLKGKLIKLIVNYYDGNPNIFTLHLESFETIKDIKEKIHTIRKILPCQQQIFVGENEPHECCSLSECGLHDGSCIVLKVSSNCTLQLLTLELLDEISHLYCEFAILLGLKRSRVECFKLEYKDSPHRCLIAILDYWVNNDMENVSWKTVADALEHLRRRDLYDEDAPRHQQLDMAARIRSKYLVDRDQLKMHSKNESEDLPIASKNTSESEESSSTQDNQSITQYCTIV